MNDPYDYEQERIDYLVGQLELAEERGTSAWIEDSWSDDDE